MQTENEYGKALFLLTDEEGCAREVWQNIRSVSKMLTDNPDYIRLIDTPAIPKEKKLALIDEAFAPVNEYLRNLIKILCEKRAFHTFFDMEKTFNDYYYESRDIVIAEAITAVPLTDKQILNIQMKIGEATGKNAVIDNTVDPSILGGVILRYNGKQLDGSVKSRLDSISLVLKNTVI